MIANTPDLQICSWCGCLEIGHWRNTGVFVGDECWRKGIKILWNVPLIEEWAESIDGESESV